MIERPTFKSEADLCDAFAVCASAAGFTVYPETAGWDQLLVRGDLQVGVQAKQHANVKVLAQCIEWNAFYLDSAQAEGFLPRTGPTVRAVLVPWAPPEFKDVARELRLHVFEAKKKWMDGNGLLARPHWTFEVPDTFPDRLLRVVDEGERLPSVVPQVRAGVPGPTVLTLWKEKAIRLCVRLRRNGYVTTADFASVGIDAGRWVGGPDPWLQRLPDKDGRHAKFGVRPGVRLPDEQHPDVAAAFAAQEQG